MLVFKCIHGNAPRHLSDSIDMAIGIEHITCAARLYIEVQWPGMRFQMLLKTPGHCLLSELISSVI